MDAQTATVTLIVLGIVLATAWILGRPGREAEIAERYRQMAEAAHMNILELQSAIDLSTQSVRDFGEAARAFQAAAVEAWEGIGFGNGRATK